MAQKSSSTSRSGKAGTAIVWFRNDLRFHDNEALLKAFQGAESVVPLYCFDPRHFEKTRHFDFAKTGELRAQFLVEAVSDLRSRLQGLGSELLVRVGTPESVLPTMAKALNAHTIYAQRETCSEEVAVERGLAKGLVASESGVLPRLQWVWGTTLYHKDDLPFDLSQLPDVYTQFRKSVESRSDVRPPLNMPTRLNPIPPILLEVVGGAGPIPSLSELGLTGRQQDPRGVMKFVGGESAALARVKDYFWTKDCLKEYKSTRNGMKGPDYSTKFSPWLALGCLSPRYIHAEVGRYEKERVANDSTYWVVFELLWRDYFRFLSVKAGNSIFHLGGPRGVANKQTWRTDGFLMESWQEGRTGYPLVDANMRELAATGFMSNRGRQIVCSFFVRDMGMDWRMGAEWFESMLLDHDPASNYGNWTYGAGVGNDPREDRYFSIPKQGSTYDPQGEYIVHWLPELVCLPTAGRHAPHKLTPGEKAMHGMAMQLPGSGGYPAPIVKLMHGGGGGGGGGGRGRGGYSGGGKGGRGSNYGNRGRSGQSARF